MTDLSRLFALASLPEQIAAVVILGVCALIILSASFFLVPAFALGFLDWLKETLRPATPTNVVDPNEWAQRERASVLQLHQKARRS